MNNFADRLLTSIKQRSSYLVAGFDPQLEALPAFILKAASAEPSNDGAIYSALMSFHKLALETVQHKVAAVKPNIAFFEQYGLAGLRAFADICKLAKDYKLPVIADIKRGDIGSTAKAYSAAFLGRSNIFGRKEPMFDVDAITVNPFLGFDTIETYFDDCSTYGKGLFVLVKTSNPGSASIQGLSAGESGTVSEHVASWLAERAANFMGSGKYSSLGAVVGATYPGEAKKLRELMPKNLFLIPGMGAQGGSAKDAVAGFGSDKQGGLINISRGLLAGFTDAHCDNSALGAEISKRAEAFNAQVREALVTAAA
ncbi:MAG: orotidine-5'-phosphate decarboxylase [Oligoflexia bacterium]|nr:orotidine-5'-phosphate decarboxylase [Oligoflexia bacterium]